MVIFKKKLAKLILQLHCPDPIFGQVYLIWILGARKIRKPTIRAIFRAQFYQNRSNRRSKLVQLWLKMSITVRSPSYWWDLPVIGFVIFVSPNWILNGNRKSCLLFYKFVLKLFFHLTHVLAWSWVYDKFFTKCLYWLFTIWFIDHDVVWANVFSSIHFHF